MSPFRDNDGEWIEEMVREAELMDKAMKEDERSVDVVKRLTEDL